LEVIRELFGDNPPVDYFKHDAYIQHPNAQKAYKTTAAACHCAKGQQKAADAKRALLVYDPARHTALAGAYAIGLAGSGRRAGCESVNSNENPAREDRTNRAGRSQAATEAHGGWTREVYPHGFRQGRVRW
jgi:hypothetical protein